MKKLLLLAGLFCSVFFVSFAQAQVAPTCSDGILNQWETSVDCGGSYCVETCDLGETCRVTSDCASDYCNPSGICATPTCSDGIQNQGETTTDCGGDVCGNTCAIGQACSASDGSDCASGYCSDAGTCAVPTCFDGYMNQDETYPDTGGTTCAARSANKEGCAVNSDCASDYCASGVCTTENAPFLATFNTATPGESITLPLVNGYTYNFTVEWGDTTSDVITAYDQAERTHVYAAAGNHQISITGSMPMWKFGVVPASKDQIISVDDAGDVGFGVGVTDFMGMFYDCTKLTSVALFDTSAGISFATMFRGASSLTTIPLFNTRLGGTFYQMLYGTTNLTSVPLFDTSEGINFGAMFKYTPKLTSIPLFNIGKGTVFTTMFHGATSLTSIPLLNTREGTIFGNMFLGATALNSIPLLNTGKGIEFNSMFQGTTNLTTIPLLNTSNGTNFNQMFNGARALSTIPLLDTGNGTNFFGMFVDTTSLTTIPLLDTSKGTNFAAMFSRATSLTTIPELDVSLGTNFKQMFMSNTSLLSVPNLDTGRGVDFTQMFQATTSLTTMPSLDTRSGTNFTSMFNGATNLTTIPLLDTSKGTTFSLMFNRTFELTKSAVYGARYSVAYDNSKMPVTELRRVFTEIGEADNSVTQQTLNITGNPGQPELTVQDYADVMAKGWEVIPAYVPTAPVGGTCANLTTSYFEKFFYHDNPQISAITTALKDYQYYDCDNKIFRKGNASQQMEDISLMLALRLTTAELATMNTNKSATEKQSYYDTEARVFKRGLADGSLESVSADERMLTTAEIAAMTTAADGDFYYNMTTLQFYIGKPDGTLGQLFAVQ